MIRIRVDDNGVARGLAQSVSIVRREANRELREGVKRITLPTAQRLSPRKTGRLASRIRAGAAGNRGYIENKIPYAGLIEFGGTRRDVIRPRHGQALSTPAGAFARVSGPRVYRGQHKMQRAIDLSADEVLVAQLDGVAIAVARAVGGTVS